MTLLALLVGLIPVTAIGWMTLRLLEGKTPVLDRYERVLCGFALGTAVAMFAVFTVHHYAGVALTWWSILAIEAALCAVLGAGYSVLPHAPSAAPPMPAVLPASRPVRLALCLFVLWTLAKIAAGLFVSFTTPTFYDDAMDNWNYRAKVYAELGRIPLALPPHETVDPLTSYPPAVPLIKAHLAMLRGEWSDGVANAPHTFWLLAAGGILWFLLRRRTNGAWALLGAAVYWSLPLVLMHGTNPYADVFLSLHYLCATHFLLIALGGKTAEESLSGLRLAVLPMALLPFTKNEGFALYLPSALLLLAATGWILVRDKRVSPRTLVKTGAWLAGLLGLVLASWIGYKVMNGLTFGNAKGLSGIFAGWQENVLLAITINTFLEGNWLLLFPVLTGLLLLRIRDLLPPSWLTVLALSVLVPYGAQLLLFLFTVLSAEALMQTGYARGLIHIMPLTVALTVILLQKTLDKGSNNA